MARMGELEPSVLVVPNLLIIGLPVVPEALPIEIEYLQKNFVWKAADGRSSGRITRVKVSFGGKLVYRESLLERTVAEEFPQG